MMLVAVAALAWMEQLCLQGALLSVNRQGHPIHSVGDAMRDMHLPCQRKNVGVPALLMSMEGTGGLEEDPVLDFMWLSIGGFGSDAFADGEPDEDEEKMLRAAFDAIDTDGSGAISSDELLKRITQGWSPNSADEDVRLLVEAADEDGDVRRLRQPNQRARCSQPVASGPVSDAIASRHELSLRRDMSTIQSFAGL